MNEILEYFKNIFIIMIILMPIYFIIRYKILKVKPTNKKREILLVVFILYMIALTLQIVTPKFIIDMNGIHIIHQDLDNINIIPFYFFYDIYNECFVMKNYNYFFINIIGNIILFIPIGIFLPLLWNVSYSSDATVNTDGIDCLWTSIADIIKKTNFMVADKLTWKKKSALPNNVSHNKLTRICEEVFVFCRKDEYKTFYAKKEVSSIGKNGQTFYKPIYNFIEAANNDGSCKLNKATYSSELCVKLLNIYAPSNAVVFDPFMGSGTTGIACEMLGFNCIGTEISEAQVEYSYNRLKEYKETI